MLIWMSLQASSTVMLLGSANFLIEATSPSGEQLHHQQLLPKRSGFTFRLKKFILNDAAMFGRGTTAASFASFES
jgi:hypothetical protein